MGTQIFHVTFLPFDITVKVPEKTTLWEAAKLGRLPLKTPCGSEGACGECIVQVLEGPYTAKPSASLSKKLVTQGYTLACQTQITADLTVLLPRFKELPIKSVVTSDFFENSRDQISGFFEISPDIKFVKVCLPDPTLEDNYSDLKRLKRELNKKTGMKDIRCSFTALQSLAHSVRAQAGNVEVVCESEPHRLRVLEVYPKNAAKRLWGAACDIGTSTVACSLVDLETGKIQATTSGLNQQIKCGHDIISRINYAQKSGGLKELQSLILKTINNLIEKAASVVELSASEICCAVFAGNTTMIHLLLGLEPRFIREEPYVPTFNELPPFVAKDVGIKIHPEAGIHFAPAVGSYVGGDITAGILCTPLLSSEKVSLFIDAGTNGELVVGNQDWLMTCACSAGPAFEGSGTACGMPARQGAIERIKLDNHDNFLYSVIGDTAPQGICGSGLVDLMSELFIHGFIDRQGKFTNKATDKLVENEDGVAFLVESEQKSFWGKDMLLTEKDIANLIRTKGAVYSACLLLLKNVGLEPKDIDAIYIAGGFGRHLNIENAIRIGLVPDLPRDRFFYLGNSSLTGAYLMLLSHKNRTFVKEIAGKMTYIELNTEPRYMNEYTGSLFLPHTDMELFPSVRQILCSGIRTTCT